MKTVLVTGGKGFIGKNLIEALSRMSDVKIINFGKEDTADTLQSHLEKADFIYHLAGVNRSERMEDFEDVNVGLTRTIIEILEKLGKNTPVVMSSSLQAELDNVYGISKKKGEQMLIEHGQKNTSPVYIYRLPNVFGKWSKPNYNSVVSTFCYNISHDLDISISDENKEIELVYIDDVVKAFTEMLGKDANLNKHYYTIDHTFKITLGELAGMIYKLMNIRNTSIIPDLSDGLMKCLYATYLSYLEKDDFAYNLELKTDQRGELFELIKSKQFGQIFVSKTHSGIVRGNHYHNTKIEKFCLIQGKAVIKLRHIFNDEVISYHVSDAEIKVVDIPPGYTHLIENIGEGEMIVLFWANEIFDPNNPDT
ncbi:MAG TPA: NAD-dependent epimerase/dehydratase family protein, partial [Anaerovoracaceae bacterium]|nr:NAD-dependent epimerase/dehydratase family protein [Anaerovoracaceae bacterium]